MWTELFTGVGLALARTGGGWLKNSYQDKVIQPIEWQQLCISSATTIIIFVLAFIGFGQFNGLNEETLSLLVSVAISPLFDKLFANIIDK